MFVVLVVRFPSMDILDEDSWRLSMFCGKRFPLAALVRKGMGDTLRLLHGMAWLM